MRGGKTELERYLYGVRRAEADLAKIKARMEHVSDETLKNPVWVIKTLLYALWLGLISPWKRTAAGRGYHDKMVDEIDKQKEARVGHDR